jgi:tetratricopeptide (TPR) repeat protein
MIRWPVALAAAVLLVAGADEATLLRELQSGSPAERRAAAARLGEVGSPAAAADVAKALRDPDPGVRQEAHDALWGIWLRSGKASVDALLQEGIRLMQEGRLPEAASKFGEVIAAAPEFAEGWNKRATVYYLMGDYDRSISDCEEVIRRNPIHFGALSGFGLNYLKKGDLERAAEYFERALAVNPNLEQVEAALEQIRELAKKRRRESI